MKDNMPKTTNQSSHTQGDEIDDVQCASVECHACAHARECFIDDVWDSYGEEAYA